jgi:transposase-like protein
MRKYDEEFKREAVRKIHDGQSVASVARELGCAESLLHNWKRQAMEVSSDSEREVVALRKKLREVEMERDILKKCMAPPSGSSIVRTM